MLVLAPDFNGSGALRFGCLTLWSLALATKSWLLTIYWLSSALLFADQDWYFYERMQLNVWNQSIQRRSLVYCTIEAAVWINASYPRALKINDESVNLRLHLGSTRRLNFRTFLLLHSFVNPNFYGWARFAENANFRACFQFDKFAKYIISILYSYALLLPMMIYGW